MSVDASGLEALIEEYATETGAVVRDELEKILQDAAPVSSGAMRDAITVDVNSGGGIVHLDAECDVDYASYTDTGSDPHVIEGNPILAFEWNGETVFFRKVNHPGSPGTDWWEKTMPDHFQQAVDVAVATVQVAG